MGWAKYALACEAPGRKITLRIVDRAESSALNEAYRGSLGKVGPTNVLSFPFEPPPQWLPGPNGEGGDPEGVDGSEEDDDLRGYLGDLIICAPVLTAEAAEQVKSRDHHWAHIVFHGILHLVGFDHETDKDALRMENREREMLAHFGIPDPYRETPIERDAARRGARA